MKKIIIFVAIIISIYVSAQEKSIPKSLSINGIETVDYLFGVKIEDPYRNIENLEDTTVKEWFKTHSIHADSILSKIAGRDYLISKIMTLRNRKSFLIKDHQITENNFHFYLKKDSNDSIIKLYYKVDDKRSEILLYSPENFKKGSENNYSINYFQPSWNGKYIVVSMSYSGKEVSEMIIIDVENQKVLPEIITNCWPEIFLGVNWLPDNRSFTYLHIPVIDSSNKDFLKNTKSVLYEIGQDPKNLNVIFSSETHSDFNFGLNEYPVTQTHSSTSKYIIGYIGGTEHFHTTYYASIADLKNNQNIGWKPLYNKEDKVYKTSGVFDGKQFIFKSAKNAPNYQIALVDSKNFNFQNAKTLVKSKQNEIIDDFVVNTDGIYYTTIKNGVEVSFYYKDKNENKEIKIPLPKKSGNASLSSKGINSNEIWITIKGWLNENERYKYGLKSNTFTSDNIIPQSVYPEFEDFVIEEVLVPSHDGVEVPLSIIYHKNTKKNSKNPVFIYGYGAYGKSRTPYMSTTFLSWVVEGGIFCVAHVRGGGEKGDAWHKAGQKLNKPNTWKDVIACTEYLIENGYTSKKHTAIYGASAGGIMVGRAITERPDLFTVAISDSGMMNPLRSEARMGGGGTNYKEYGTIKDSLECMGLIEMDPYLHIKENTQYPALLFTSGMNDPRVPAWIPGKFIARTQNSGTKRPIIFDVNYDAGHKGSSSTEEKWANFFAFALWQMGHPDYQLKE